MKTNQNSQSFKKFSSALGIGFVVLALGLSGCQKKEDTQAQGGVDGSGGDMSLLSEELFKTWTEKNLKYALRDVVHRVALIQKNSPNDLIPMVDLTDRLLGNSPEDLQALIMSIQFFASNGPCPSSNRPNGDASALPDQKICFSYQAFKRFREDEFPQKMLPLALHELSHFRGFDEKDATRLQQFFEADYGIKTKTILQKNPEFKKSKEVPSVVINLMSSALSELMDTEDPQNRKISCQNLTTAHGKALEASMTQGFPDYLNKRARETIFDPLSELANNCENMELNPYSEELVRILKNAVQFSKELEYYQSPTCEKDNCANLRYDFLHSADDTLLKWELNREWFLTHRIPPKVELSKLTCVLEDVLNSKKFELQGQNEKPSELDVSKYPNPLTIYYSERDLTKAPEALVNVWGLVGDFQILDSSGFTSTPIELRGWLQKGVREKAWIHFVRLDRSESVPFPYTLTSFMGPEFYMVGPAPKIKSEYKLTCELSP